MTKQNGNGSKVAVLVIIALGILLALLLLQYADPIIATVVFISALTLGAYVYAGWERAWAVGVIGSLLLAFVIGATLVTAEGQWIAAGLLALIPPLIAVWMMFEAATQLLIVWRGGDRQSAGALMAGFFVSGLGRLRSLLPGPSQSFFSIQVISKGAMTYSRPPSKSIRMLGPGMIIVDSGNAVILEKNGQITRVEGPGFLKTEPYEILAAIVDLGLQKKTLNATTDILTRDGIPLQVTCTILFRIVCDEKALIEKGKYCVDPTNVHRAILWAADWMEQTELVARTVLRDKIAERRLNEIIYQPRSKELGEAPPSRAHLQEIIRSEVDRQSREWGVEVVKFSIDEIHMPDAIKQRMLDHWDIDWRYIVELSKKVTDGEVTRLDAITQRRVTEIKRQTSEIEAMITAIEARAQADAHLLERRGLAIAEAERFQRVLGAIQQIAGRERMAELTHEMIRVLTSVNDVQAVVRMLGLARRPMLAGPDEGPPAEEVQQPMLDQEGGLGQ
jgi:regulator of protease activity HflC (stomatin/prohibitin superfamily)